MHNSANVYALQRLMGHSDLTVRTARVLDADIKRPMAGVPRPPLSRRRKKATVNA
jgi:hypothetical protein